MKFKVLLNLLLISWLVPLKGFSSPVPTITVGVKLSFGRGSDCLKRGLCSISLTGSFDRIKNSSIKEVLGNRTTIGKLENKDGKLSLILNETLLSDEIKKEQFQGGVFVMEEPLAIPDAVLFAVGRKKPPPPRYIIPKWTFLLTKRPETKEIVIELESSLDVSTDTKPNEDAEEVIIDEPKDIIWDEKTLVDILGYKSIRIPKGTYIIRKTKMSPYGKVILNVTGIGKINKENLNRPFPGPWSFNSGLITCDLRGFLCCKLELSAKDKVIIQPIYTKGNLTEIEIEFLTEGITNGKMFSNVNNQPTVIPQSVNLVEWSKNSMVMAVNYCKPYFKKGQSLKDFISSAETSDKSDILILTDIFNYLNNGDNSITIQNNYTGKSIIDWWKIRGVPGPYNPIPSQELIKKPKCNFWCKLGASFSEIGNVITKIDCIWRSEANLCQ